MDSLVGVKPVAIYQDIIWFLSEHSERIVHSLNGGTQDIDAIDHFGFDMSDGPGDGFFFDDPAHPFTVLRRDLLAVVETRASESFRKDNGGSKNRACEAATTCFIAASFQSALFQIWF